MLGDAPETVNQEPYTDGWMFRIRPSDEGELDELLDSDDYAKVEAEDS